MEGRAGHDRMSSILWSYSSVNGIDSVGKKLVECSLILV